MTRRIGPTLLSLAAMGCRTFDGTPELGDATYHGLLRDGDLDDNVRLVDRDSALNVEMGDAFRVEFDGVIEIYERFTWHEVEGSGWKEITDIIEEDDGTLTGSVTIEGITIEFSAWFEEDRALLNVDVEKLGFLILSRVEPPEEEGPSDTGDTSDTASP